MIKQVSYLEKKLSRIFTNLPDTSNSNKLWLVKFLPWFALIVGALQVNKAFELWGLLYNKNIKGNGLYLVTKYSAVQKLNLFIGIIILGVSAITLFMAYKTLKKRRQKGWDLLFMAAVLNIFYVLFVRQSVAFLLIASTVGFYALFQVKAKYKKSSR